MRGKSSSSSSSPSKSKNGILEAENNLENLNEAHVSSAYIRSLVKQLSSSRTKGSSSKGNQNSGGQTISCTQNPNSSASAENMSCDGLFSDQEKPHQQQQQLAPQQHKKQVRRRLHTSRPYQERLLNMAEARREIVTALKFHRASMKKAREEQQQQQQEDQKAESGHGNQPFDSSPEQNCIEQDAQSKSRRNPRIYASNSLISGDLPLNYPDNYSYSPGIYASYSWSTPHIPPPPLYQENLNFTLPSQTLGLNLNLQDFNNLDASAFNCSNNPFSIYSASSSASTSSSPLNLADETMQPCFGAQSSAVAEVENSDLHHAIDDKEMAELRSIGEQYQMEWNDTMSLVNSAWWFKFLKAMEAENNEDKKGSSDKLVNSPFCDEVMEFPAWINANDDNCANDLCCYDYFQDPTSTLPCMDIEEIEGMDGAWLA